MYFLVRLVMSLKMSDLHFFSPLNSKLTFSCCQLSIFWLFCICNCSYVDSLRTRGSLCAVAGAASWSASWCCLGVKGCLPKTRRKDLTAQTHRLCQHAASVLPQHCLEDFFFLFWSLELLPLWACCALCFYTFSVTLEESSLEHRFGGLQIFAYSTAI